MPWHGRRRRLKMHQPSRAEDKAAGFVAEASGVEVEQFGTRHSAGGQTVERRDPESRVSSGQRGDPLTGTRFQPVRQQACGALQSGGAFLHVDARWFCLQRIAGAGSQRWPPAKICAWRSWSIPETASV